MTEENKLIVQWVKVGVVCGILGDICYGVAISIPMPELLSNIVFWAFGPLLIAAAPGIYNYIKLHRNSISLQLGTIFLMIAGISMTIMAVVQRSVFQTFIPIRPEKSDTIVYEAWKMGLKSGNAVQLGMDIVWDIFILLSTIFLAIAMFKHPRLGKFFSLSGITIGLLGLFFNFSTFPTPPANAGSFDIGPIVGIWYLIVMIFIIINFKEMKKSLEVQTV